MKTLVIGQQRPVRSKSQPLCRTDFQLELIAHRFINKQLKPRSTLMPTIKNVPKDSTKLTASRINKPLKHHPQNLTFNLRNKLETRDAQQRLITEVEPAAIITKSRLSQVIKDTSVINKLPHMQSCKKKDGKFINDWWRLVFDDKQLRGLAGNCRLKPYNDNYGLVYIYIIAGQVRYVGKTVYPLFVRMTKKYQNGRVGYSLPIKRNLLNAFRVGELRIATVMAKKRWMDDLEKATIHYFAPTNQLWNQKDNLHFHNNNFWV